jgi:hypothetical protein
MPMPTRRARLGVYAAVAFVVWLVVKPIFAVEQLDPDDYRYLDLVGQLRAGRVDLLSACIVENRWDHLWWIDSTDVVRFFRPALVLSFLADDLAHGGSIQGLLATNAMLYLGACLLAAALLLRLLRRGLAAGLAAAWFAGCAAHAETIWYVSGRNETLAAIGLFAALLLHGSEGRRRWLAVPCYALALLAKELTLPFPLLALAFDRLVSARAPTWRQCLRGRAGLYAAYVAVALAYLAARQSVLAAAGGTALVFPYFVSPARAGFLAHVWRQFRSYGENLLLGSITPPFLHAEEVGEYTSIGGTVLAAAVLLAAVIGLRRDPRTWWLALLAVTTWLPTSVVYVCERYLFVPSFAVAGAAGLAAARAPLAAGFAVLLWGAHQTSVLEWKNRVTSQTPHQGLGLHALVAALQPRLPAGKPVYALNLPADLFGAQFFGSLVRRVLGDPARVCHVLTISPENWFDLRSMDVRRVAADAVEVRGAPVLMRRHDHLQFPQVSLATGTRVERSRAGCAAHVLQGEPTHCQAVRFQLPLPLDECVLVRFVPPPPPPLPMTRGELIRAGRLEVLRP